MLLVENSLHGGFGSPSQAGMTGHRRLLAHMSGQGFARPQFGRVAQVLGLGAGQMYHPSFVNTADERLAWPMKSIFETDIDPHLQNLVQPVVNRNTAYIQSFLDGGRIFPRVVQQQNARPLHFTHGGSARSFQAFKTLKFLRTEDQSGKFGLSGHASNCEAAVGFCKCFNETMY